jgi:hypothetical protein
MTTMGPLYRAIIRVMPKPGEQGKGKAIGCVHLRFCVCEGLFYF